MTNNYILSNNIVAFPVGRRNEYDGDGKAIPNRNGTTITESRLSSLINSLLDINGFVVFPEMYTEYQDNNDQILEINILGRYFKIKNPFSSLGMGSDYDSIYLGITISTATNELYDEVYGQDDGAGDSSEYRGLRCFAYTSSETHPSESSSNDNTYGISITEVSSVNPSQTDTKEYTCIKVAVKITEDGNSKWIVPEPDYSKVKFIDAGEIGVSSSDQSSVNNENQLSEDQGGERSNRVSIR